MLFVDTEELIILLPDFKPGDMIRQECCKGRLQHQIV